MNKLVDQLTVLKLHGMALAITELLAAKTPPSLVAGLKQLIEAETVERDVRRIRYQMTMAKFPHHKDFATFEYG